MSVHDELYKLSKEEIQKHKQFLDHKDEYSLRELRQFALRQSVKIFDSSKVIEKIKRFGVEY